MSFEFGSKTKKGTSAPLFQTTGLLSQQDGGLSLDPSLRRPQNQILSEIGGLSAGLGRAGSQAQEQFNRLRTSLEGNQGAFLQARTNPLRESFASQLGGLQRSQGLRGISGSSFANQDVQNLTSGFNRQLGDQTSLALMDTIKAQTGLSEAELSMLNQSAAGQAQLSQIINQIIGTEGNLLNLGQSTTGTSSKAGLSFSLGGDGGGGSG